MSVSKIKLGLGPFDDAMHGIYTGRPTLCCGPHGSGKSVVGCQFIAEALNRHENVLLLTRHSPHDVLIIADALGHDFTTPIYEKRFLILEYNNILTDETSSDNVLIPPDAFNQLKDVVADYGIKHIVFDDVLPWVAIHPVARLQKHIFSFIRALERLQVTALLNIPRPISPSAKILKEKLTECCPIVFMLENSDAAVRVMSITKYVGIMSQFPIEIPYTFSNNKGIVAPVQLTPGAATPASMNAPTPAAVKESDSHNPISNIIS